MTQHRTLRPVVAFLIVALAASVSAQGLRLPGIPIVPPPATTGATDTTQRPADYIVAIVNSEPITNHQVRVETQRIARQMAQSQQPPLGARELAAQALERLIGERAQLHQAREIGIKIEELAIDEAEQSVARQNQIDLAEIYRRLALDGIGRSQFRGQLRDQLMLVRVREREVAQKVRVSELDIDQYLREQQKNLDESAVEMNIAQVLVALPDDPGAAQVAAAQAKAQKILDSARAGADFAGLAREFSDAPDAANGGQFGLRRADRYPPLFVEATRASTVGGLSIVRSGAGIHVLKLLEKRAAGLPPSAVAQTRASHILLRLSAQLTEAAARDKLADFRKRILAGQADFASLAKENSQDGSAALGGDLGWTSPGQLVPEFEDTMNSLAPGQVSEPLVSRFGVHLIEVKERRTTQLGQREQRDAVRALLRERKLDEAYAAWAQDLRARAYVEMREPPG